MSFRLQSQQILPLGGMSVTQPLLLAYTPCYVTQPLYLPAPVTALKKATSQTSGCVRHAAALAASRLPPSASPTSAGMVNGRVMRQSSQSTLVTGCPLSFWSGVGTSSPSSRVVEACSRVRARWELARSLQRLSAAPGAASPVAVLLGARAGAAVAPRRARARATAPRSGARRGTAC